MHPDPQVPKARRRHDAQFKSKVILACSEPGASVASVAMAHGLNANLVRNWLHGRGLKRSGLACAVQPTSAVGADALSDVRFVPIALAGAEQAKPTAVTQAPAKPAADPCIHIELRRGASKLSVRWPAVSGADCAAWLRELCAGWPQ